MENCACSPLTFIFIFGFFVPFRVLCGCWERKFEKKKAFSQSAVSLLRCCRLSHCRCVASNTARQQTTSRSHAFLSALWNATQMQCSRRRANSIVQLLSSDIIILLLTVIVGCIGRSIVSIWAWSSRSAIPHVVWLISVHMNHRARFVSSMYHVNFDRVLAVC